MDEQKRGKKLGYQGTWPTDQSAPNEEKLAEAKKELARILADDSATDLGILKDAGVAIVDQERSFMGVLADDVELFYAFLSVMKAREKAVRDDLPDGTGAAYILLRNTSLSVALEAASQDLLTWRHVLESSFYDTLAETDLAELEARLIKLSEVAVSWSIFLKRRQQQAAIAVSKKARDDALEAGKLRPDSVTS